MSLFDDNMGIVHNNNSMRSCATRVCFRTKEIAPFAWHEMTSPSACFPLHQILILPGKIEESAFFFPNFSYRIILASCLCKVDTNSLIHHYDYV